MAYYFNFMEMVESAVRIPKQNFMGLKSSLDVGALVDDINEAIDKALQQEYETKEVMDWMRRLENPEFILSALMKKILSKGKKCCFGWCHLKSHYLLSMGTDKYVQDVVELLKKIRRTHEEALSKTQQKVAAAAVKDFMYFDSRSDIWEEIMVALQSPIISNIGVHGQAGVGKTMLVEKIKRKAEQLKLFDDVAMAKVTNNPDMRRIQDDIAHDLGLELPDRVTAADRIKSRLTDRKVLVILDDIWARIDLKEVEIPSGNKLKQPIEKKNEEISSVQEQTECIVLLTSRDSGVLPRDMHSHKIIEVSPLKEEEARELFEKLGGEPAKNLILQLTAQNNEKIEGEQRIKEVDEIVKGCNQLPIAIATLASTLENKNLIQWRAALKRLHSHQRSSKPEVNLSGMSPSLCSAIKLRYGDLESKQLKQTLLLCSLMGHNVGIEDLLKYGIGLGLFPKATSIEEARDEALKLVQELRRSPSFLQEGGDNMHFDMHDLIQTITISIASREHGLLDLREDVAEDMFDKKAMKECKWIYLSNVDAKLAGHLPYRLKCPQLTFFHLANKYPNLKIPDNFFRETDGLRVLGLTKMQFLSVPSSISLLTNLHTLCLDQSKLGTILVSIMGNLKNLQVLSLVGCDIEELPQETKQLAKLKLLDLSDCTKLKVILPGILKSLSRLEELYLGNSFDQWEDVKKHDKRRNASLDELTLLKNITSLEVRIHDINMIPDDLFFIELKRYKILIGDVWNHWGSSFEHSKTLKLKHDGSIRSDKVKQMLSKVEELHLEKLNGVKDVFNELDQNGFQELKYLHVKNIDLEIEHLFFNPKKEIYSEVLPKLELLFLHNLKGLQKILHGQFEKTSLEKLRIITVTGCNRLKNLFSFSVAKQLHYLQEIRVTDCSDIVEIVDDEEEDANVITAEATDNVIELAAQMQCLRLQHLTEFISFSQEKIIRSNSMSLFNKKLVTGRRIWNLTKLIIEGCDQLENLFFESIGYCLEKLEQLEIRECKKMREIIFRDAGEGMVLFKFPSLKLLAIENCPELKGFVVDDWVGTALFNNMAYFPTLEKISISNLKNLNIIWREFMTSFFDILNFLHIKDLPNLIRFCQNRESFTYLKQLTIENCPQLNGSLFDEELVFPNLKRMTVSHLKNLNIIQKNLDENSFCKLRSLRVAYCQNLSTLFPCNSGMPKKLLGSLEDLEIIGCNSVKEVFELGQSDIIGRAEEAEKYKLIVQQLKVITIAECPNMVTFASTFSRDQEQETSEPFFSIKCGFPNLELLVMEDCHKFKYLMALSTVQSFSQLKELVIRGCKKMEEVIVTEEFTKENRIPLFPELNSMELEDLLELTRFCSEPQSLQATTLFVFPKVTNLKFSKLPKLASFLSKNATEWPELTSIHVCECDQVQIFALEFPPRDNQIESRTQQHPLFWVNKGLEGQEGRSGSKTTELPAVFFVNLRTLEVSRCHGLITLLRYTIAKRLDQLSTMSITDCSKLEEIVACENDEVKEGIVFNQLTSLRLGLLSSLESFCSRECNFNFPSLQEVIVNECQKMNIFSKGVVKTEKLQKVKLTEKDDVGIWKDGDLNSSIQQLFIYKEKKRGEDAPVVAHDAQEPASKRGEFDLSSKEKKRGEDVLVVAHDAQEPASKRGEDAPIVADDAQEPTSKRGEFDLSSKEKKRGEDAPVVAHDTQEPDSRRGEDDPAKCIVNAARLLGNYIIKEVNKESSKSIGFDMMLLEKSSELDSALSKIEGLTEDERDIALSKLPDHPRQMVVFFNLSADRRLAWVRRFLMYH